MEEIISSILQAEQKADDVIKEAAEKARKIKTEGDEQAEKIINTSINVFKISRAKKMQDAEKSAEEAYLDIFNNGKAEAEKMIQAARANINNVSDFIVKKVLE